MPKITFQETGDTLEVEAGESFLDACEDKDVPQAFGCTVGTCGTCVIVVEQGAEHLSPMTDGERMTLEVTTSEDNARLACKVKVNGDVTVRPAG